MKYSPNICNVDLHFQFGKISFSKLITGEPETNISSVVAGKLAHNFDLTFNTTAVLHFSNRFVFYFHQVTVFQFVHFRAQFQCVVPSAFTLAEVA